MLFSVIIPVYNVEPYLRRCLDALVPQIVDCSYSAEVILVDDGSTDMSGEICDEYAGAYPECITAYHKQNEGLLLTRRYGYQRARGEYIINCDSDDLLAPGALRSLADVIQRTEADVVLYNAECLHSDGTTSAFFKDIFSTEELSDIGKTILLEKYMTSNHLGIISMCCKCYKRACVDEKVDYRMYGSVNQGEDFMQSAEIYARANQAVYYNKTLYYYRIGSGMTAKFNPDYYWESKIVFQHVYNYLWDVHTDLTQWENLFMQRFFTIVAVAVLQSRNDSVLSYGERKKYLMEIREDPLFEEYASRFKEASDMLKCKYRLVDQLLIYHRYRLIDGMLRVRNLVGR